MKFLTNIKPNFDPLFLEFFFQKAILTVFIITGIWISNKIFTFIFKQFSKSKKSYFSLKVIRYTHFTIAVILIGQLWFKGIESLGTFLGLFTAGVAIALKDVVTNFAGWLYLLWQAPFKIGDRIQIKDHQGDVIDIGVFKFTLLEIGNWVDANQSTGRMIRIPNADIFNSPIANYSKGFNYIWYEIPVVVTFESDWKKAKKALLDIINDYCKKYENKLRHELHEAQKLYPINYKYITPTIYTNSLDHGISLTLRYLVETRRIRQSNHELWESILEYVDDNDNIELAYPTLRHINT